MNFGKKTARSATAFLLDCMGKKFGKQTFDLSEYRPVYAITGFCSIYGTLY